ncbi:hypothetical protein E5C33_13560 [Stenotrophomonas maltophilia]|uniref:hypothetical protein n=1 Tax=Stenotrophomonas maltophilia TaxID=40324 RepID=UPI001075F36E|nr:hypothetical protein [Stenotrophomonas maltophilia]TFZ44666.1 hypothetical protein E5C33_13560 [Stenotrophomonas maltophilia]
MISSADVESVVQSLSDWLATTTSDPSSQEVAFSHLSQMRLEDLVLSLLDLAHEGAAQLATLAAPATDFARSPERFDEAMQEAVGRLRLSRLFARTYDGDFHRSVCPTAYDARTGEHHPVEMARWRADFRDMAPERQMIAATLIWMYRGGPDSIWLRRVPCTWKASEALHYLRDAGCLDLWLQLIARYPGW